VLVQSYDVVSSPTVRDWNVQLSSSTIGLMRYYKVPVPLG
jgi:hypothetical protein